MDTKICLTCLRKPSKDHNLNEIVLENLKISELLHQLVPMFLEQREFSVPDRICVDCLENLVISFKFQKQCLDALENLHRLWSENSLKGITKQNDLQLTKEIEPETNKSNDDNTMESLPEIKVDLKMTFGEIAIDPLIANYDGKPMDNAECDQLKCKDTSECNENSYTNMPKGSFPKDAVVSNQCKLCHKIFKQPQGLASHMSKTHLKKHLYLCQKCGKGFSAEEPFIRHCNRHLGIKRFPCTHCDKAFDTNSSLSKHLLSHSKELLYECTICGKKFHRTDVLKQHMQRHDDRELFECKTCAKSFKSFSDHIKHMETHKSPKNQKNEKSFNCAQCDEDFNSITNLKLHQKTHTNEKYKCRLCSESFWQSNDLEKHRILVHKEPEENTTDSSDENMVVLEMPLTQILTEFKPENCEDTRLSASIDEIEDEERLNVKREGNESVTEKEYSLHRELLSNNIGDQENDTRTSAEPTQCDLCQQVFKNSHGLARHRSSTHFKKHLYQCDQCDRGFSVEEFYIKHRNRHLGIKTFKCNQCDKAFETNSILNQHLISHSNLTPHLCTICGKSFRRLDGLRQHMLRHSDERPFKCSVCPKSFKCLSDKLNHMVRHDVKRYECNICGSRLSSPESLSQHQMIHTGEKPFKCSHCDKSFISLSNMRCHERIHTGEKPYKCRYCWKSFRQSYDRTKHTNRMHKNEIDNSKAVECEKNVEENL